MKDKNKKKVKDKKKSSQIKITSLQSVIEETPGFICRFSSKGILFYANKNFCKYLDEKKENLTGKKIFPLLPKNLKVQIEKAIVNIKKTKRSKSFPSNKKQTNNKEKRLKWSLIPIVNNKGNISEYQLNGFELKIKGINKKTFEERGKFENALFEGEHRYKSLVESTSDWIWEIDQNGFYTYSSPKVKDLLGYEPYEIIGLSPFDLMPAEEAERIKEIFNNVLKAHEPIKTIENINKCKNGKTIILETSGIPIFDKRGNFIGYRGIDRDISERKKAEEALRLSEEKYRSVVETTNEWIWELDLEGRHSYSNSVVETIIGYKPDELIGKDILEVIYKDDREKVVKILQNCITEKKGWRDFVVRWQHKDGTLRYLESNSMPMFNQNGKLCGFRGADRDITGRKLVEEALQKSEINLKKAQNVAHLGSWTWDIKNNKVAFSDEMYRLFGIDPKTFTGDLDQVMNNTIHPDDLAMVLESNESVIKYKKPIPLEYRIVLPDGSIRIVWAEAGELIEDENRNPDFLNGIVQDITERKLAEENLRKNEEHLRQLTDNMVDLVAKFDSQNIFEYVSPSYEKVLGYTSKELIGKLANDLFHPDEKDQVIEKISSMFRSGKGTVQFQFHHKNGSYLWFESTGRYLLDENGKVTGSIMGSRDITVRKIAEGALREKTEEIDRFFNLALEHLCIADTDGYFKRLNQMWETTLGFSLNELEGKRFLDFVHPDDLKSTLAAISELSENKPVLNFTNRYRCKDGTYRWMDWRSFPYKNKLIYAAARDITERIDAEEQIKKMNEELKELNKNKDKFFSLFAHDLKSPFQALLGLSDIISDADENLTPAEIKEYNIRINKLLKNQYELLQNLLDWSRLQLGGAEITKTELNLFRLVNNVINLLSGNSQKKNINILNEIDKNINISADPDMLRSILQNIISNSIKFTQRNGNIKINTKYENNFIQIIIEDNGVGIPKEELDKFFKLDEKFNTTGTESETGSGLGLLLCRDMISKHGGKLEMESEINKGTVVKFTIPLSD